MAVSLKAHATAAGLGGSSGATTSAVDTTGATLIVISISNIFAAGNAPTDNKSNTYTALNTVNSGARYQTMFYCIAPTVGSGHTFSFDAATHSFSGMVVGAWDPTSPVFDTQNAGNSSAGTTVQPGSLTPGGATNLLITSLGGDNFGPTSIGSGFSNTNLNLDKIGGSNEGSGLAWLEQASATAQNPTWTVTTNDSVILSALASFTFSGGGGGFTAKNRRTLGPRVGSRSYY